MTLMTQKGEMLDEANLIPKIGLGGTICSV